MTPAVPALTVPQLIATWKGGGFNDIEAETLAAISFRETRAIPTKSNVNAKTGDDSHGLLQVNWASPQVAALMDKNGITRESIKDPAICAKAAWAIYDSEGTSSNARSRVLSEAWYIDRGGIDQADYEMWLKWVHATLLGFPVPMPA